MDKAQGSRPLDKAFPAEPELPERGLAEQKVNLEAELEKMDWNFGEWVLATPSVRQGRGPGSQQKVLGHRRVYWEFRKDCWKEVG